MTYQKIRYHDLQEEIATMQAKVRDTSAEEWEREILRDTINAYAYKAERLAATYGF